MITTGGCSQWLREGGGEGEMEREQGKERGARKENWEKKREGGATGARKKKKKAQSSADI